MMLSDTTVPLPKLLETLGLKFKEFDPKTLKLILRSCMFIYSGRYKNASIAAFLIVAAIGAASCGSRNDRLLQPFFITLQ